MSAHVLLNFLNEFEKRDKMRKKPRILSIFPNSFEKALHFISFPQLV